MRLDQRTAVISGGGGKNGLAIARMMLESGMNVVICSSRKEKGEEAKHQLPDELQKHCMAIGCDVSDQETVRQALRDIYEKFGSIDVIVNGAGMHDKKCLDETDRDHWNRCINSTLTGCMIMVKEARPYLKKSSAARIVNLSSIDGRGAGFGGGISGSAAKGGIIPLTRAMAYELAKDQITVNAVAVGCLEAESPEDERTPEQRADLESRIPLGRLGTPEDLAPVVCFLAGEEARYITGVVLDVNGGLFMG